MTEVVYGKDTTSSAHGDSRENHRPALQNDSQHPPHQRKQDQNRRKWRLSKQLQYENGRSGSRQCSKQKDSSQIQAPYQPNKGGAEKKPASSNDNTALREKLRGSSAGHRSYTKTCHEYYETQKAVACKTLQHAEEQTQNWNSGIQ